MKEIDKINKNKKYYISKPKLLASYAIMDWLQVKIFRSFCLIYVEKNIKEIKNEITEKVTHF